MNFLLLFTFLSTIIFCCDETTTTWKKIDKNDIDIKLTETAKNVAVSVNSKDFFPLLGSWNAGQTHIKLDQFFIGDLSIVQWAHLNITTKEELNAYLKDSNKYTFTFLTDKDEFVEKNNLECKLRLIKKEDFEKIMIEYFDVKSTLTFSDNHYVFRKLFKTFNKMVQHEVIYGIKFGNGDDQMPNLDEYELGIYVPEVKNETQMVKSSLKERFRKTAIDVGKHTLISLIIVGPYAFLLTYAISKYLIK